MEEQDVQITDRWIWSSDQSTNDCIACMRITIQNNLLIHHFEDMNQVRVVVIKWFYFNFFYRFCFVTTATERSSRQLIKMRIVHGKNRTMGARYAKSSAIISTLTSKYVH